MPPARGRVAKRRRHSNAKDDAPRDAASKKKKYARKNAQHEAQKVEKHKASCAAGRARKAAFERQRELAIQRGEKPPKPKPRPKRVRGERRGRELVVRRAGDDMPGKKRCDLAPKNAGEDDMPRKARELFSWMNAAAEGKNTARGADIDTEREKQEVVKFDKMAEGETFRGFEKRIQEEARLARIKVGTGTVNRQKAKKRAYYERRKERAARRARRKRGDRSDSEDEVDDEADTEAPNNGTLNTIIDMLHERIAEQRKSKKKKHRLQRGHDSDDETPWDTGDTTVSFGERVERPPEFTNMPVVRTGAAKVVQKRVVVSDAASLIK